MNMAHQKQNSKENSFHADHATNQGDNGQINFNFSQQDLKKALVDCLNRFLLQAADSREDNARDILLLLQNTLLELDKIK